MPDITKVREIGERLNAIAPYPQPETLTAAGLARYLAVKAQVAYVNSLDPAAAPPGPADIGRMAAEFAAAHALYAFTDVAPKTANLVAAQIYDAIAGDGDLLGEWLSAHLGEETCQAVREACRA